MKKETRWTPQHSKSSPLYTRMRSQDSGEARIPNVGTNPAAGVQGGQMLLVGTQGSQVVECHAPVTSSDTMNRRSFSGHRCWKFEFLNMYATSGAGAVKHRHCHYAAADVHAASAIAPRTTNRTIHVTRLNSAAPCRRDAGELRSLKCE